MYKDDDKMPLIRSNLVGDKALITHILCRLHSSKPCSNRGLPLSLPVGVARETTQHQRIKDNGRHVARIYRSGNAVDDSGSGGRLYRFQGTAALGFPRHVAGAQQQLLEPVPVLVAQQSFQADKQGITLQQGQFQI